MIQFGLRDKSRMYTEYKEKWKIKIPLHKKKLKWKRIYYFPYFSIPTPTSISPSFHSTKHYSNDISCPHICIKYSSHWATLFCADIFLRLGEWTGEGRGKVLIISMLECMKIYKMNRKFNKISARGKWTFGITNLAFFNFYFWKQLQYLSGCLGATTSVQHVLRTHRLWQVLDRIQVQTTETRIPFICVYRFSNRHLFWF
jgi:hypothetical protein